MAQLSDRYEKKEWEEITGNCDTQLFLGCNDQMTAEYISKKCGMATIKIENNQMPLMPLFSPVLHSTRPYSQTKSNTQRALMLPDEVLRLPNDQSIVLIRGQKPLMLYKIIPDELPSFDKLTHVRIADYLPNWKRKEDEMKSKSDCKGKKETELFSSLPKKAPALESKPLERPLASDAPNAERRQGGSTKYSFIPESCTSEDFGEESGDLTATQDKDALLDDDVGLIMDVMEEASPHEIIG